MIPLKMNFQPSLGKRDSGLRVIHHPLFILIQQIFVLLLLILAETPGQVQGCQRGDGHGLYLGAEGTTVYGA